jgi:SAM-dependent methyltransferase
VEEKLTPGAPVWDETYFQRWNYARRGRGRFSMYALARRYYAALLVRHAPRREPRRVLELGCGPGHLLGLLQDDFEAWGLDVMPFAVEESRRNAPRARVEAGDAQDLGRFADDSFSAVVSLHVLEHLAEPAAALREAARVLEPGGVLLFATPHPGYALRRLKDPRTDAIGMDPTHINCHPPARWSGWARAAGLETIASFGDGLWDVPYLPLVPARLQLCVFGLPALIQVATRTTFTPLALGVNQVHLLRKPA